MSDLALNTDTLDLDFSAGELSLTSERNAIRQRVAMRLRLVKGEWFLNYYEGTDYYGQILGKKTSAQIDAELTRVILTTDGVTGFVEPIQYVMNRTTRILEVSFEITTTEGTIPFTAVPLSPIGA